MFQQLKYYHFLLFSAAFFVLMALVLPIRFEDNDDVLMLLFASGSYTGSPEFRLVFINSAYGWVLKTLYSINDKIEWYTVLFSVAHIVSLSVIVWSIFKKQCNTWLQWAFAAFFLVLEMRLIAQFQFTTTAALLALAGLALHTLANNKWKIAAALSMFVVASLIRFEAAILVFILYSPIWIKQYIDTKSLRTFIQLSIALVVVGAFYVFNIATYTSNAEWKTYYAYNKTRGMINDNPNAESIQDDLPTNIKTYDYDLLLDFFPDYNKINHRNIDVLHDRIADLSLYEKIINLLPKLAKHGFYFVFLLLLSIAIYAQTNRKFADRIVLLPFVLAFGCSFLLSLQGTLKTRVFLSIMLTFVYVMYKLSGHNKSKRNSLIVMSLLNLYLLAQSIYVVVQNNSWQRHEFRQQKQLVERYFDERKGLLTQHRGDFDIEQFSPFKLSSTFDNERYVVEGWLAGIPYNKNKIFDFDDLINKNAIFISKKTADEFLENLQSSIAVNYGIKTTVKTLYENELYMIIRIVNTD